MELSRDTAIAFVRQRYATIGADKPESIEAYSGNIEGAPVYQVDVVVGKRTIRWLVWEDDGKLTGEITK